MSTVRLLAAALLLTSVACGDDEGDRVPLSAEGAPAGDAAAGSTLSSEARASLEAGNAAFRTKDYAEALAAYRTAATQAPTNVAPLWGIQMAARAMGNAALADSATARMREISPEAGPVAGQDPHVAPGAPSGAALPADHPPVSTPTP